MMRLLVRVGAWVTISVLILIAAALVVGALTPGDWIAYTEDQSMPQMDYFKVTLFVHDVTYNLDHPLPTVSAVRLFTPRWEAEGWQLSYNLFLGGVSASGHGDPVCSISLPENENRCYSAKGVFRAIGLGWTTNINQMMVIGRRMGEIFLARVIFHKGYTQYAQEIKFSDGEFPFTDAVLSPDAQSLLFIRDRTLVYTSLDTNLPLTISSPLSSAEHYVDDVIWSTNGQNIAYTASLVENGAQNLYVINTNSLPFTDDTTPTLSTIQRTASSIGLIPTFAFSPDGLHIIYSHDADGEFELYSIPTDGSAVITRLTQNNCLDEDPEASPDGRQIVYLSDCDNPYGYTDVWIMDADGSNQRPLTRGRGRHFTPRWRPQPGY